MRDPAQAFLFHLPSPLLEAAADAQVHAEAAQEALAAANENFLRFLGKPLSYFGEGLFLFAR